MFVQRQFWDNGCDSYFNSGRLRSNRRKSSRKQRRRYAFSFGKSAHFKINANKAPTAEKYWAGEKSLLAGKERYLDGPNPV